MSKLIATDDPELIREGSQVNLHFSVSLADGTVVDSNFEGSAAALIIGDGNLPPEFEKHLRGARPGDRRKVQLEPEEAFGEHREQNVHRFTREAFHERVPVDELETGLMVSFAAPNGELPGVVSKVTAEQVVVDFNHPLAGYVILFEFEILTVAPPQPVSE